MPGSARGPVAALARGAAGADAHDQRRDAQHQTER